LSVAEFFSQGGYAGFVWGAYGMVAALMIAEVVVLGRNRRTILARLGRLLRARGDRRQTSERDG
jgi:heme exporter protein D